MALDGYVRGRQCCPMTRGQKKSLYRFKEFREAEKLTLEQLAADVDLSVSQLSRFESGGREPRVIDLLRIAERLKVPWPEMVAKSSAGWTAVPIVSPVSAGKLVQEQPVDLEDCKLAYIAGLPDGDWIAMKVHGSSMDRISPPESVIFVNRRDKRLVPNACYVIEDDDEGVAYKRYRPDPMRFEPVTFTEGHKTIFPENEPKILGRVRKTILDL